MATKEQMKTAIQIFVDRELANKGSVQQKFLMFAGANLLLNKIDTLWTGIATNPTLGLIGMFDEKGNVDADSLLQAASLAMEKVGSVNVAGIVFSKADIESFQRYLQEATAVV